MRNTILIIVMTLCAVSNVLSQGTNGDLEGWIIDNDGEPLESVNILISSPDLLGTRGTTTNQDGYFIITSIPPGNYTVSISRLAYRRIMLENVIVILERTTSVDKIELEPEAIGLEEVIVSDDRFVIDINSTSYGQNFSDDNLALLPLERDYQQISQLTPEAKESYLGDGISIAGASGKENKYFINGVGVTDPWANWYATKLPYNFVKEIQIKTGAYEPEYESSLGGLINVITNSGSNDFYGQAFTFFTNDQLSGNTISVGEPPKGSFIQTDVGLGIGGPIVKDRLWFYGSYNAQFNREELLISNLGYKNYSTTTNLFAGKLTWLIDRNNKIEFVGFGDPTSGNVFPDYVPITATFLEDFNASPPLYSGNLHAMIQGDHTINNYTFLESYVSLSQFEYQYNDINSPTIHDPLFYDHTNETISGDGIFAHFQSEEIDLGLKASFQIGSHLLKTGLEFLNSSTTDNFDQVLLDKYGDSSYVKINYVTGGKVIHRVPTVFIQDSWLINSFFRMNFGFRWNYVFMIGSDGKVAQTIPDQFAPRFGLIFLPEGNNKQKLSLSLCRFYHTFPTVLSSLFYSENTDVSGIFYTQDPRTSNAEGEIFYESNSSIYPEIGDLEGPHYDEVTLSYEKELPLNFYGTIRLIYRKLVEGIEDGVDPETGEAVIGNPGRGDMKDFPEMQRDYTAFEVVVGSNPIRNFYFQSAYILSRAYGNYTGFYDTETGSTGPINPQYDTPEQLVNGTGLLAQDRTHTFKFFGSYYFDFGISIGTSFFIASGKPLSVKGGHSYAPPYYNFLQQRGTNGRTPTVWDLNFRLSYDVNKIFGLAKKIRLLADVLHVASDKTAVQYDEIKYFNMDEEGNQINPNPNYGQPISFQPPISLRLGLEIDF